MANFTACAKLYIGNTTLNDLYQFPGRVTGIPKNGSSQITYEGCLAVCGPGNDYYSWKEVSNTVSVFSQTSHLEEHYRMRQFRATIHDPLEPADTILDYNMASSHYRHASTSSI